MEVTDNTLKVLENYVTDIERKNPNWRAGIRSYHLDNHDVVLAALGVRAGKQAEGKCKRDLKKKEEESDLATRVNGHAECTDNHEVVGNGFGGRSGEDAQEINGVKEDHLEINEHEENVQEMNGCRDDHRETDQESGRPGEIFRTALHTVFGRHLVAARNIRAGEVVIVEPPFVLAPKAKCAPCCMACLAVTKGDFVCPGCGFFLCGLNCMKKEHEEECYILRGLGLSKPPEESQREEDELLAKRIASLSAEDQKEALSLTQRSREASSNSLKLEVMRRYALVAALRTLLIMNNSSNSRSILLSLQDHLSDSRNTKRWWSNKRCIVDVLTEALKVEEDPELIHRVCGVWDTNGFEVALGHGGTARALYPLASLITHSCRANCQQWFTNDGTLVLRAVENVEQDQIITASYTEPLWSTQLRQDHLRISKYFTCLCERCEDPTEMGTFLGSLACPSCRTAPLVSTCPSDPGAPWRCHGGCQKEISAQKMMSKSSESVALMKMFKATEVKTVDSVIRRLDGVLYPTHHALVQLKLVNLSLKPDLKAMDDAELHQWATWMRQLHDVITCLEAPLTRQRARIALEYVRAHVEVCRRAREEPPDGGKKNLKDDQTRKTSGGDQEATLPISNEEVEVLKKVLKNSAMVLRWDSRMTDPTPIERDFEQFVSAE